MSQEMSVTLYLVVIIEFGALNRGDKLERGEDGIIMALMPWATHVPQWLG